MVEKMQKRFFLVGLVLWIIILVARTWPTGPYFLFPERMNQIVESYGEAFLLGGIVGEIFFFLFLSYG